MATWSMTPETDKLIVIGGNSERAEVLQLAASALDAMGIFSVIDVEEQSESDKTAKGVPVGSQEMGTHGQKNSHNLSMRRKMMETDQSSGPNFHQ